MYCVIHTLFISTTVTQTRKYVEHTLNLNIYEIFYFYSSILCQKQSSPHEDLSMCKQQSHTMVIRLMPTAPELEHNICALFLRQSSHCHLNHNKIL